jgi:aspartate aminotransferase/aminotransferase
VYDAWIAARMERIESSGIRKVFELARDLPDPINLSIGQPDFDVPEPIKEAAKKAIDEGHNGYTVTQGIAALRARLAKEVKTRYPNADREVIVTSGTSGGLVLALLCTINPGDEVIVFDPYFVLYPHLVGLAGGQSVYIDTYPDFQIDVDRVRDALSPRTKAILLNSPANPTGAVYPATCLRDLAELARERGILLFSDEIYQAFCYDGPFASPAANSDEVVVFDGFSKTYAMTGWRLGYAHGPRRVIEEMIKLQQFTFVCAPSMAQHAGLAALDVDISSYVAAYRKKRDFVYEGLKERYDLVRPGGAFYLFLRNRYKTGSELVAEAIRNNLLLIPGGVFSRQDSHSRLSYAADDKTLERGVEVLNRLARR